MRWLLKGILTSCHAKAFDCIKYNEIRYLYLSYKILNELINMLGNAFKSAIV